MTEEEMMKDLAEADSAGDTELAQAIATHIKATRAPAKPPGLLQRAVSNYQQFSRDAKEEQQRRNPGGGLLDKDAGDVTSGISSFLSGLPGAQPGSAEQEQRLGQFRQEHPILGRALPIAGAMGSPVPGPLRYQMGNPYLGMNPKLASVGPALPEAMLAAKGPISAALTSAGEKLSSMPMREPDLLDVILASMGKKGMIAAGVRKFAPAVGGAVLKKAGAMTDPALLRGALRGAGQEVQ